MQDETRLLIISTILVLLLVSIPKFVFPSQYTPWNVFYERQTFATYTDGLVPTWDEKSYLGREMTFIPGYFVAKASFLRMLGLEFNLVSDLLFEFLLNFSLILSLIYLTRSLCMSFSSRLIFVLAFVSGTFIFVLLSAHLMHTLSLALLFFSIGCLINRENHLVAGLILGASVIVHAFSIVLFPIILYMIKDNIRTRDFVYPMLIASILFSIIFAPTFAKLGIPYQVSPNSWGYLTIWDWKAFFTELLFVSPFTIAGFVYSWYRDRKTAYLFLLSLALFLFLSFRFNIILIFISALMIARMITGMKSNALSMFTIIIILVNVVPAMYVMTGFWHPCDDVYLTKECTSAMSYLSGLPSSYSIIAGPIYGHALTFLGNKNVLADPYVEYADSEKFQDILEFEKTNNLSLAEKWGVDLALVTEQRCNGDLTYDNGYLRVCDLS